MAAITMLHFVLRVAAMAAAVSNSAPPWPRSSTPQAPTPPCCLLYLCKRPWSLGQQLVLLLMFPSPGIWRHLRASIGLRGFAHFYVCLQPHNDGKDITMALFM